MAMTRFGRVLFLRIKAFRRRFRELPFPRGNRRFFAPSDTDQAQHHDKHSRENHGKTPYRTNPVKTRRRFWRFCRRRQEPSTHPAGAGYFLWSRDLPRVLPRPPAHLFNSKAANPTKRSTPDRIRTCDLRIRNPLVSVRSLEQTGTKRVITRPKTNS